ncbi:uncharacterized protein LOC134232248 [Saccostrea cucullata]|uniref:uncharacterized protein LOC134232248 n=1 Tax=Saccostrea cuccullata TaxID=36930 RepID=UPI002ED221EC
MKDRFGKTSLRAASQLEFNSICQRADEAIEQWGDRVMDTAQKAIGGGTSPEVFQEQIVVRFALGCNDGEAGQQLINNPPGTLEEAIKRVKTYQLSRRALARRPRAVRSLSRDRQNDRSQSPNLGYYRARSDSECQDLYVARRESSESRDRPNRASRDRSYDRASRDRSESPDWDSGKKYYSSDSEDSTRGSSPERGSSRDPSPNRGRSRALRPIKCFECQEPGHLPRDCPIRQRWRRSGTPKPCLKSTSSKTKD